MNNFLKTEALSRWTTEDAAQLYGVREWGAGYFEVSETGEVLVRPRGRGDSFSVSLLEIVRGLRARGLDLPVLLRFSDILASRIEQIYQGFTKAMNEAGYRGAYKGVYPIKVNQQQHVVEEVIEFGRRFHHGLEAGSKAELVAALAFAEDPEALIVCNGYKDEEFIDLALCGMKMGRKPFLVLEMPGELALVLERAQRMNIRPLLGVRAKLAARGGGHWTDSGGDRSMFGLNASQIIDVVDRLRELQMLDCLQMLHYHVGSQIPNIRSIRGAAEEACRFYVDLVREGAKMGILNVGGGLAVDYDGSHTNYPSSCNYTIDEYAADIVEAVYAAADAAGVAHPTIVSESGRATVSHHSLLLFNILDVTRFESHAKPEQLPENAHELLQDLMLVDRAITAKNLQECYNDAVHYRDQIRDLFNLGQLSLRERAMGERIFWHIAKRIANDIRGRKYIPDELAGLEESLADVYHCNFSVFQSLPDCWAIEQLFPIMPIHRLNEPPARQGTLADITCDCDGRINRFIDLHDVKDTLPLHELNNGSDYILGVFLVGAYQETLGDLHNLLGDTNVVSVRIAENGTLQFDKEIYGDTVADVLSYVEYDTDELVRRLRAMAEQAVRTGQITAEERRAIMDAYESGLRGYTYFES
jgi:arginine decarboxylase